MHRLYRLFLLICIASSMRCGNATSVRQQTVIATHYSFTGDIDAPPGFSRVSAQEGSFNQWLRRIPLKNDTKVRLYNGTLKKNQDAQFAILDISVGKKDLQQCADAVIRLRSEYLFARRRYAEIQFYDNDGKVYAWKGGSDRKAFDEYLEQVFAFCGTASLSKQLKPVNDLSAIKPGDVFIKGGFPGHAMIVVDVAQHVNGDKQFMLAQSYMPAQDIHIVKNPLTSPVAPWYSVNAIQQTGELVTPEWKFSTRCLKTW